MCAAHLYNEWQFCRLVVVMQPVICFCCLYMIVFMYSKQILATCKATCCAVTACTASFLFPTSLGDLFSKAPPVPAEDITNSDEKASSDFYSKLVLARLAQYGQLPSSLLGDFLNIREKLASPKGDRRILRTVDYFIQLLSGDTNAGTPIAYNAQTGALAARWWRRHAHWARPCVAFAAVDNHANSFTRAASVL